MRVLRTLLVCSLTMTFVACKTSDQASPVTTPGSDAVTTTGTPTTVPTTSAATTTSAVTTVPATTAQDTTVPVTTTPGTTAPATTTPATTTPASTVPTKVVPGPPANTKFDVVLLDAADQLNVRTAADPAADIVARLDPTTVVTATGKAAEHDGSIWYEVTAKGITGWANTFYLTTQWSGADFQADPRVTALLDQLLTIMRDRGDLRAVTGKRGLIVSHFDPPRRFKAAELATLLTSTTEYGWGSSACSPEECGTQTFAATFADPFVQAYDDTDRQLVFNQIIGGGNMMLQPIPEKFTGVNYVAVYDPGDNPDFAFLDWSTWYVYMTLENGKPVIVGLSTDEWAP